MSADLPKARTIEAASDHSPLILVVDDDPMQQILVRETLLRAGYRCEIAEDGNVGIEKSFALLPDLVILDVMMPGLDGFSVCSELRQHSVTESTPVLMMTALDDLGSIEKAFEAGATSFQTKPIDVKILPHHVKYMLRAATFEQNTLKAKRLAEEASASKSQFLANMSHELRTPLNAVLGFSEMIHKEILGQVGNKKYLDYAKDIHGSAAHLLNIINDILDISKVESGEIQLHEEFCCIQEFVEKTVQITQPLAEEAGLKFQWASPSDPPMLRTDLVRLRQVLINLLSNAIKFTPASGHVRLDIELTDQEGIRFMVVDNGIGIPADEIDNALRPFGQVDSDLNRKYDGTGLGLPLAKTLTEQLGGTFQLESEEGSGTRVTVSFPSNHLHYDIPPEMPKLAS